MGLDGKRCNKGEWAELYVLLKLLGDGWLPAADSHLARRDDAALEVMRVFREGRPGELVE